MGGVLASHDSTTQVTDMKTGKQIKSSPPKNSKRKKKKERSTNSKDFFKRHSTESKSVPVKTKGGGRNDDIIVEELDLVENLETNASDSQKECDTRQDSPKSLSSSNEFNKSANKSASNEFRRRSFHRDFEAESRNAEFFLNYSKNVVKPIAR
ncbi:hypothetical protein AAMO2058_000753800 [Amorphochlora amoebiformis]